MSTHHNELVSKLVDDVQTIYSRYRSIQIERGSSNGIRPSTRAQEYTSMLNVLSRSKNENFLPELLYKSGKDTVVWLVKILSDTSRQDFVDVVIEAIKSLHHLDETMVISEAEDRSEFSRNVLREIS